MALVEKSSEPDKLATIHQSLAIAIQFLHDVEDWTAREDNFPRPAQVIMHTLRLRKFAEIVEQVAEACTSIEAMAQSYFEDAKVLLRETQGATVRSSSPPPQQRTQQTNEPVLVPVPVPVQPRTSPNIISQAAVPDSLPPSSPLSPPSAESYQLLPHSTVQQYLNRDLVMARLKNKGGPSLEPERPEPMDATIVPAAANGRGVSPGRAAEEEGNESLSGADNGLQTVTHPGKRASAEIGGTKKRVMKKHRAV
ncbi:hypothetical protein V1520DRAFT_351180, partial [Lipomyces starkeyi]